MSLETNLWGEIPKPGVIRTPLVILREQAALLGEMTNRILEADVDIHHEGTGRSEFVAELDIIAPFLDHYRVTIARIRYDLTEVYPVELIDILAPARYEAGDNVEFVRYLKSILSSEKVQRVISSLLSQVRQ